MSMGSPRTARPYHSAGYVTWTPPRHGALPSTWPVRTATRTPSSLRAASLVPPKRRSIAPAASTSTTPLPGARDLEPARTYGAAYLAAPPADFADLAGAFAGAAFAGPA